MEQSSNTSESFKSKHSYSIITALIIALLTCGYLFYILPNNETKENTKNIVILQGIEQQLKKYIDDQVQYISEEKIVDKNLSTFKGSKDNFIDTITINKDTCSKVLDGKITLARIIKFSPPSKKSIHDTINIDLAKFLSKINSTTQFTSFYICPIENGVCLAHKSFPSQNVSLVDQDSLIKNNRKNGPFTFKGSTKRYYADQIKIPNTNYSIFLAAGIDSSVFQTSIRQIDNNLLIFSLLLVIILILGINFIKPIVSSYKERLSQTDLVSVAFSTGILIAVLVVFGIVSYWDNAVKTRSASDLKGLVDKIDSSFNKQITAYQHWEKDSAFVAESKNSKNKFLQIHLKNGSEITSLNGESYIKKNTLPDREDKSFLDIDISNLKKGLKDSLKFDYLDNYFRMDGNGLITTNFSASITEIRRKYADRMYFQMLQQRNPDNQKTDNLLTAVFSREDKKYQWIYAEKNPESEEKGIKGIAFREYFSENLTLPPGTGYMLIDRNGEVLMQNDREKNLYQNLRYGSKRNLELISLLSGIDQKSFDMEYQGTPYQVYAKKLDIEIDSPVYILGIRDLSHLNRLSLFTFSNGFLISLFYGFFILVITYIYSALFYADRLSLFSNHHFYHLFPDNTRTYQYKQLLVVNSIAILMTIIVSLLSSPSIAFIFCTIVGVNLVLINLITLNIRTSNPQKDLITLVLILLSLIICLFLILFFFDSLCFAIVVLFGTHAGLIFYYRGWREREKKNLETFKNQNKGVNRKVYTRFLTARLIYHFAVFPFVLISALYVNELNDFASFYCSSNQTKEQNEDSIKKEIINTYSCNCNEETEEKPLITFPNSKDDVVQKANIGFLDRPAMFEIKNFTLNPFIDKYYLNSKAIVQNENLLNSLFIVFSLFIAFFFLTILVYHLLNYYSNRFFFYDLMQAAYEKYYPCTKNQLANDHIFIAMINDDDVKALIQINKEKITDNKYPDTSDWPKRKTSINKVFDKDKSAEISPYLRMDFILNYNNEQFADEYNEIWESLPEHDETRNVLYDFAQDHFVNYKNKDILMSLMEIGIIDCHQLTGRLKMMSLSFRIFILSKSKRDQSFITKFKDEGKNGTFSKLKIPILIIAISALILLMYLNKDSYDRVAVMGGSIVSVIALINKFLEANKTL
ncbi:hypothetical protein [uncultured Flavobacterium sp.]|uniref:hypothetical protein n=1 Tax=uncultured Flavobacterium sp. TaxID=165435 RepID=UPI00292D6F5F|nr:hypothetical protein [uncultured Flavobacterium sp.]